MPLDNTRRYRHTRGGTISRPRFPTPERGVEGYPYMCQGHSTLRSHVLDGVLRLAIPNRDFPVGCS